MPIHLNFTVPSLVSDDLPFLKAHNVFVDGDLLSLRLVSAEHAQEILDYFRDSSRLPTTAEFVSSETELKTYDEANITGALLSVQHEMELDYEAIDYGDNKPCRWYVPTNSSVYVRTKPQHRIFSVANRIVVHESLVDFLVTEAIQTAPIFVNKRLYPPYLDLRVNAQESIIVPSLSLKTLKCRCCNLRIKRLVDKCLFSEHTGSSKERLVNDALRLGHFGQEQSVVVMGEAIELFARRLGSNIRMKPIYRSDSMQGIVWQSWASAVVKKKR